eukprot:scaffold19.g1829.t1
MDGPPRQAGADAPRSTARLPPPQCQVPGCDRSLHKLRDYYKRYKICPYHLELPSLCGRFQLLADFEGDRRSCRTKLNKHNERRRKAEAESKAAKAAAALSGYTDDDLLAGACGGGGGGRRSRISPAGGRFSGGSGGGDGRYAGGAGLCAPPQQLCGLLQQLAGDAELQRVVRVGGARGAQGAARGRRRRLAPSVLQGLSDMATGSGSSMFTAGLAALAAGGLAPPGLGALGPGLPAGLAPPLPPLPPPPPVSGLMDPSLLSLLPNLSTLLAPSGLGGLPGGLAALAPPTGSASLGELLQALQALQQQPPLPALQQLRPQSLPQPPLPLAPRPVAPQLDPVNGQWQGPLAAAPSPKPPVAGPAHGSLFGQPSALSALTSLLSGPPSAPTLSQQQQAAALRQASDELARMSSGGSAFTGCSGGFVPPPAAFSQQQQQQQPVQHQERQVEQPLSAEVLAELGSKASGLSGSHADAVRALTPPAAAEQAQQPAGAPARGADEHMADAEHHWQQQQQRRQSDSPAPVPAAPGPSVAGSFGPLAQVKPEPAPAPPPGPAPLPGLPHALDLVAVQAAVGGNSLSPAFAQEAMVLLHQIASAAASPPMEPQRVHNLSIKLFQCTPEQLPPTLLAELERWVVRNPTLLEGSARPGCVHLHFAALVGEEERERLVGGFPRLLEQAVAGGDLGPAAAEGSLLAQQGTQAAVLERGRLLLSLNCAQQPGAMPRLLSLRPLADCIFCRRQGSYPLTEVVGKGQEVRLSADVTLQLEWVQLHVPALAPGAHQVEAQRGLLCSEPLSFLVLDDAEAAAELRQLEASPMGIGDVPEFLHKVGIVLQFQQSREQGAVESCALPAAAVRRVARAAQEVAVAAVLRGWPALLAALLPAVTADCGADGAVAGMQAFLGEARLLQAAVTTGVPRVLSALGAWAQRVGYTWRVDEATPHGLTALHVAAMLAEPQASEVALALTALAPRTAPKLWYAAASACGLSPLEVAVQLRRRRMLAALARAGVGAAAGALRSLDEAEAAAAAGAAPVPHPAAAADERATSGSDADDTRVPRALRGGGRVSGKCSGTESPASVLGMSRDSFSGFSTELEPFEEELRLGKSAGAGGAAGAGGDVLLAPRRGGDDAKEVFKADWTVYSFLAAFHFLVAALAGVAGLCIGSHGSSLRLVVLGLAAALPAVLVQPRLVASPAWRQLYLKYRDAIVVLVQAGMLAAQHALFRRRGAAWLGGWLASRAPGAVQPLLPFAASLLLQLPPAFLVPLLLASFATNLALVAAACLRPALACVASAAAHLGLAGVAAPLLAHHCLDLRGAWRRRHAAAPAAAR